MCVGSCFGKLSSPPAWLKKSDLPEGANTVCVCVRVTQIPASVENCFEQKLLCLVVVDSVAPASVGDPEKKSDN